MRRKEDKKGEQQVTDSGQIPLVFVNGGAEDDRGKLVKPTDRKRSRVSSTVSMDSSNAVDQAQGAGTVRNMIDYFFLASFKNTLL